MVDQGERIGVRDAPLAFIPASTNARTHYYASVHMGMRCMCVGQHRTPTHHTHCREWMETYSYDILSL